MPIMSSRSNRVFPAPAALVLCLCLVLLCGAWPAAAAVTNVVTQWNDAAQAAVRTFGIPNQLAGRLYGALHLAQYWAVRRPGADAAPAAAAAYAGHTILSGFFPWLQSSSYDGLLASQLSATGQTLAPTLRQGVESNATTILRTRVGRLSGRWANFTPAPAGGPPFAYQLVPGQTFSLYPQLAADVPFVISKAAIEAVVQNRNRSKGPVFVPPKTPADYDPTFTTGAVNSPERSQYSTDGAAFWADGANTSAIGGHWYQIAALVLPSDLSIVDTALAYARLGTASYAASIACWRVKYSTLHWRPITAFRQGYPGRAPVADWTPLLRTPPHPEYPSGHQCTVGAFLEVLVRTLGTELANFTIGTEGALLAARYYTNLTAAAVEVGDSRQYGGVHFPSSNADGLTLGRIIGGLHFDALT